VARQRQVGNLLAVAVLSYLAQAPMHPYEMSRTLRNNGDARSIKFNHGSLYMVVKQLAKVGLVVSQEATREGQRPERTVYAITEAGRQELHDWLRELIGEPQHEYPHFVVALSLIAALPPGEVVELLTRRLGLIAERRTETRELIGTTLAAGVHPLFLVEEEYRLELLAAESSFVERFVDQITNPRTGWGPQWTEFHSPPATTEENHQPCPLTRPGPP
jgi:DNA-binding PadR family transcriptional regulator